MERNGLDWIGEERKRWSGRDRIGTERKGNAGTEMNARRKKRMSATVNSKYWTYVGTKPMYKSPSIICSNCMDTGFPCLLKKKAEKIQVWVDLTRQCQCRKKKNMGVNKEPTLKFTYELYQKILSGEKTETRRLLSSFSKKEPPITIGKDCLLFHETNPEHGKYDYKIVQIKELKDEKLQDMSQADAHAEGFLTLDDFISTWNKIHRMHAHNLWAANPNIVVVRW